MKSYRRRRSSARRTWGKRRSFKRRSYTRRAPRRSYKKRSYKKRATPRTAEKSTHYNAKPTNGLMTHQVVFQKGTRRLKGFVHPSPPWPAALGGNTPETAWNKFIFSGNSMAQGELQNSDINISYYSGYNAAQTTGFVNDGNLIQDYEPDGYSDLAVNMISAQNRYDNYTAYGSSVDLTFVNPSQNSSVFTDIGSLNEDIPGPAYFTPGMSCKVYVFPYPQPTSVGFPLTSPDVAGQGGQRWNDESLSRLWGVKSITVPPDGKPHRLKHFCSSRAIFGSAKQIDDIFYSANPIGYQPGGAAYPPLGSNYAFIWVVFVLCDGFPMGYYTTSNIDYAAYQTPPLQVDMKQTFYWKLWGLNWANQGTQPLGTRVPKVLPAPAVDEGLDEEAEFVEILKTPTTPSAPPSPSNKASSGAPKVSQVPPSVGPSLAKAKLAMANRLKLLRQLPRGIGSRLSAPSSPQRMDQDP